MLWRDKTNSHLAPPDFIRRMVQSVPAFLFLVLGLVAVDLRR